MHDIFFVVCSPSYSKLSGGIHALHCLAEDINNLNYKVGLFSEKGMPGAKVPIITIEGLNELKNSGMHIIAVYPEIVTNNFLNADYSIWWLLNYPGFLKSNWNGDVSWCDRIIAFGADVGKNLPYSDQLTYPLYDPDFFFENNDVEKKEIIYYANRILQTNEPVETPIKFTGLLTPESNFNYKQLRNLFWKTKILYTREWSGVLVIAQLCGVPVILIESPILNKNLRNTEALIYGAIWSDEEKDIDEAKKSLINVKIRHIDRKIIWPIKLKLEIELWINNFYKNVIYK
jgi:hypothetical protein